MGTRLSLFVSTTANANKVRMVAKNIVSVSLFTLGVAALTSATPVWANTPAAQAAEMQMSQKARAGIAEEILSRSGMGGIVAQLPLWVDEEVTNLNLASIALSEDDIAGIRDHLNQYFIQAGLLQRMSDNLAKQFDGASLFTLQGLLLEPQVLDFQERLEDTERDYVRAAIRQYKAKIQSKTLKGRRVDLLRRLNSLMGLVKFEADIKVELRKQLLNAVSWVKTGNLVPEMELEQELEGYHKRLMTQLNEASQVYYLYVFRQTPTAELEQLVNVYNDPEYRQLVQQCRMIVVSEARLGRQSSHDKARSINY